MQAHRNNLVKYGIYNSRGAIMKKLAMVLVCVLLVGCGSVDKAIGDNFNKGVSDGYTKVEETTKEELAPIQDLLEAIPSINAEMEDALSNNGLVL